MADLDSLEKAFISKQWIGGQAPCSADREAFDNVKMIRRELSAETHPNVFAWYNLCCKFTEKTRA